MSDEIVIDGKRWRKQDHSFEHNATNSWLRIAAPPGEYLVLKRTPDLPPMPEIKPGDYVCQHLNSDIPLWGYVIYVNDTESFQCLLTKSHKMTGYSNDSIAIMRDGKEIWRK